MSSHKGSRVTRDKRPWKQPYRKSRRFDATCRCNGGCPSCEANRLRKHRKNPEIMEKTNVRMTPWLRVRFLANLDDSRPVKWPPPGPTWETGFNDYYATRIAYVKTEEQIHEYWPEAKELDVEKCAKIIYSDRFPKPKWFNDE